MTVPRIVVVTVMCRNERMWVRVVLTMIPGVSEMGEEENGDYAWFCAAKCRVCVCVCVCCKSFSWPSGSPKPYP